MSRQRIVEQIHGILARSRWEFRIHTDGDSFLVPMPDGSAAVFVDVIELAGRVVAFLRASVLEGLELDGDEEERLLRRLNELNRDHHFARFAYLELDGRIVAEHELFADHLDGADLIGAIASFGSLVDRVDDELLIELGEGLRARDAMELAAAEEED